MVQPPRGPPMTYRAHTAQANSSTYPARQSYNRSRSDRNYVQLPAERGLNSQPRNSGANRGGQSTNGRPIMRRNLPKAWATWPFVQVRLYNLHPTETTWNIHRNFSKHGNIENIDLYERDGQRYSGRVKFSAGVDGFWESQKIYQMSCVDNTTYNIKVELMLHERGKDFMMTSPIRPHIRYPQVMNLFPTKLHFGLMVEPTTYMSHHTIERANGLKDLKFVVDAFRKRVMAEFVVDNSDPRHSPGSNFNGTRPVGDLDRINVYKFQIPFDQLKIVHEVPANDRTFQLIISLSSPPAFNRKREDDPECHSPENLQWSEFDDGWYRQTDIVYDPYSLTKVPIALHKDRPVIDIGRWTSYIFEFSADIQNTTLYGNIKQALQDHNVETVPFKMLHIIPGKPAELWSMIDPPQFGQSAADHLAVDPSVISLPFEVRYQLEVCISRELLNEYNIEKRFVTRLAEMASTDKLSARNILEYAAEGDKRIYDPMTLFDSSDALAFSAKTDIPHYCAYSRKATITPSTMYFSSPAVETTNRVLRHYSRENHDGRFLRVQFTDEFYEGRINSCIKQRNDEIFTRVYRTLANGIRIGDRHYKFLAFGNSQFRENGAYFFCESDHLTCNDIRNWMGNFSHIDVAAKYAARLGQCFSTTRAINGLPAPRIAIIPDIEHNGYIFSDGVGKISPFLAQMITAELNLRVSYEPSAFQFRLGGCKGLLVTWPDAKDREVHIRKSQQKFTAVYNGLEIIRCSQYSVASLNRQTITILSDLGVKDSVFLKLMKEQLSGYESAMENNNLAIELLCRYIDDNRMTINIAKMIGSDIKDPFVSSLLHLWRSWSIKLLKEKAKIIIEKGAFVFGCVDETHTLRGYKKPTSEGAEVPQNQLPQIFIQVPVLGCDPKNPVYNVIEGICLVGRNPSLHPGDLRICQAVDVPALHHIRDVVVFPSSGERDVPSMCSGGDLDGDDFFVIWDKDLQPTEWNCSPMDFTPPPAKTQRHPVQVKDLTQFFVRYMKNDSLPTIALAHLAQADALPEGVKDHKCIKLAHLHSQAVDYVKSGNPAEMPKALRPRQWPHFMERKHKSKDQVYNSKKVLGQLYDEVQRVDFVPQWKSPFDRRILDAYKLEDSALKVARQLKSKYDIAMRRIMAQQQIKTEFEVWSTFVLSKSRLGSDYKLGEEMGRISETLKEQFRALVIGYAGKDFSSLGPFVAGMYKVTKEELDRALAECSFTKIVGGREVPARKMEAERMPLISFPWLFENILTRIVTGKDEEEIEVDLPELVLKAEKPRNRQPVNEDAITQENGLIVHRGEILDLFRPKATEDDSSDIDNDEASDREHNTDTDEKDALDYGCGVDSPLPRSNYSESGSDSFVAQPHVDGLTNKPTHQVPPPQLAKTASPPSTDTEVPLSLGSLSQSLIDLEEGEPGYVSPVKASSTPVRRSSPSGSLLDSDNDEEVAGEEEITSLDIEETPMEKLARMMAS
jgi:RNA-dependent RNA polymerase